MIKSSDTLQPSQQGIVLAANVLFITCCFQREDMMECVVHFNNALQLIRRWGFWNQRQAGQVSMSACKSKASAPETVLPTTALLLFFVQLDAHCQDDSSAAHAWQWGPALLSLQDKPFVTLSDACLELEMMWIGVRGFFNAMPLCLVASSQRDCVHNRRHMIRKYFENWVAKFHKFRHSQVYTTRDDEGLISTLDARHIILGILLSVDIHNREICWDAFERQFERAISSIETLFEIGDAQSTKSWRRGEGGSVSYTPSLTKLLHHVAKICRHPVLRRRAISLLRRQRQIDNRSTEEIDITFFTQSAEAIVSLEESEWHARSDQPKPQECICIPGRFICNGHRVFDCHINHTAFDQRELVFRTVNDVIHNRTSRSIPLSLSIR